MSPGGPGRREVGGVVAVLVAVGLLAGWRATAPAPPATLQVLAAASLDEAMVELGDAYEASRRGARPGLEVTVSSDGSSAQRARIEAGGGGDVFASADVENPAALDAAGLTDGPPVPFAGNLVALIVPSANPAGIRDPYDLVRPGVRIVQAARAVPIARYTEQLIANLQAARGAQAGLPDAIEANTVSREDNVRAVLAKVALGEADAGFVYATDAASGEEVRTIPLPAGTAVEATYAAVALADAADPDEAAAFVRWLTGADAGAILARHGFRPPP